MSKLLTEAEVEQIRHDVHQYHPYIHDSRVEIMALEADTVRLLDDHEERTRLLREVLKREHRLSHESDCEGEECTCGLDALLAEIGDAVHP